MSQVTVLQTNTLDPPPVELNTSNSVTWISHLAVDALKRSVPFPKRQFCYSSDMRVSSQLLYMFGDFCWIADVQLYVLLLAISSCVVPCSKDLLHSFLFMLSRKQFEMDLHSLTARIPVGFVTDFHRQSMTFLSGLSGLGYFSTTVFTPCLIAARDAP